MIVTKDGERIEMEFDNGRKIFLYREEIEEFEEWIESSLYSGDSDD